jgi:hypothetical protein
VRVAVMGRVHVSVTDSDGVFVTGSETVWDAVTSAVGDGVMGSGSVRVGDPVGPERVPERALTVSERDALPVADAAPDEDAVARLADGVALADAVGGPAESVGDEDGVGSKVAVVVESGREADSVRPGVGDNVSVGDAEADRVRDGLGE